MSLPPILLTSSVIAMDPTVALKNQEDRLFYTLESIKNWGEIIPDGLFVICDGSGFDFSLLARKYFPHLQIESIYLMNSPESIKIHGKGYGEGEIISYALAHSEYLQGSDVFVKCTAKLWVNNFLTCLAQWNGQFICKAFFDNVFSFKESSLKYIDTRFYISNKKFYIENLNDIHQNLSLERGTSIEDEFLRVLRSMKLQEFLFRNPPIISGVGGGSGKYYNSSGIRQLKEILRNYFICQDPKFKKLFSSN